MRESAQVGLWFLDSIDRVNRAIAGTHELEQMMCDVLDVVLDVFDCDRAWLSTPPVDNPSEFMPIAERTRPAYPGGLATGRHMPAPAALLAMHRNVMAATGPLTFDEAQLAASGLPEALGVRSMMVVAIRPKQMEPYAFGLHQCSRARTWTRDERDLLVEIGDRVVIALNALLLYRELRASERRLVAAEELANIGYWDQDVVTRQVKLSAQATKIFGLPPDRRVLAAEEFRDIVHPDDRERVAKEARDALLEGRVLDVEGRVTRADGAIRLIHTRARLVSDSHGKARHVFGTAQDVTERRLEEVALHETEARFRAFVDHATDALVLTRQQRARDRRQPERVREPRLHARRDARHDAGRLRRASDARVHPRARREVRARGYVLVRFGLAPQGRLDVPGRDSDAPVLGGRAPDRRPRARHHQAQAGRGQAARERGALPADDRERVGSDLGDQPRRHLPVPEPGCEAHARLRARGDARQALHRVRASGRSREEAGCASIARSPSPARRSWSSNACAAPMASGACSRPSRRACPTTAARASSCSIRATSPMRAQLEEQFRQAQKMEAIGQLAGGVAHDFNNILAAIMMQTGLSQVPGVPDDVKENLEQIQLAAERAAELTRQLLMFSRRQLMQPRDVDLNDLVKSLAKMLQRIIGETIVLAARSRFRSRWSRASIPG